MLKRIKALTFGGNDFSLVVGSVFEAEVELLGLEIRETCHDHASVRKDDSVD